MSGIVFRVLQELGLTYNSNIWFIEEDLSLGTKFYSALFYCPHNLLEGGRLSKFFESLITKHNLRTIVAATMHSVQPRTGKRIEENAFVNSWYKYLDERYNFSLAPALLSLFTTEELEQLISLETPFLDHVEDYHYVEKSK